MAFTPSSPHRESQVLVAGGAGFIGSHLCRELLERGDRVVCMDNLVTGRLSNVASLMEHPRFSFVRHSIIDPIPNVGPLHRIYHLASPASPPGYQRFQIETLRANSEGTRILLELAVEHAANFLFCSTSEIYGDPLEHPQSETYRGNVSSIGPRSMYDEAKRFGEAMTMAAIRTRGANARIVRIFNTYGPNSDPNDGRLVPNFVTQALGGQPLTIYGDGTQTRSLCYVSDLVAGLISAMEDGAIGIVVNLGNPQEHTVLEFAKTILRLTDSSSSLVFTEVAVGDDPQRRRPDSTLAKALLNWTPTVDLESGLLATIEYFRSELLSSAVGDEHERTLVG